MKVIIKGVEISSVSAYLPEHKRRLSELYPSMNVMEKDKLIAATGIQEVRIANANITASDLCFEAALNLLEKECFAANDIDGIVFVSQTTDYILPSTSIVLQDRLGCSKETICQDIHYGCSGYIYGLLQAALWVQSGLCKHVLLLAGDTTSRIIHPEDKSLMMVFGDAGTATIVSKGKSEMAFNIGSDGSGYDKLIIPAGGFRTPVSEHTKKVISDIDNNQRTAENLYMDGLSIFNFAITHVHKNINQLLEYVGWEKEDVGLFALHQANAFMLNHIGKRLKVDACKIPSNCRFYGNTGPATIPLLLSDKLSEQNDFNTQKAIFSGFGVGLSWGSVCADLSETRFYKPINS